MIFCQTRGCKTTGIYIHIVEAAVLDTMVGWCARYSAPDGAPSSPEEDPQSVMRESLVKQIDSLNKQLDKMYDLVEQGVYTPALFVQRSGDVKARIAEAQAQLDAIQTKPSTAEIIHSQLPQIRHVLEAYHLTDDLQKKNALLKSVIHRIDYHKTKQCTRADYPAVYMTLDIYPMVHK